MELPKSRLCVCMHGSAGGQKAAPAPCPRRSSWTDMVPLAAQGLRPYRPLFPQHEADQPAHLHLWPTHRLTRVLSVPIWREAISFGLGIWDSWLTGRAPSLTTSFPDVLNLPHHRCERPFFLGLGRKRQWLVLWKKIHLEFSPITEELGMDNSLKSLVPLCPMVITIEPACRFVWRIDHCHQSGAMVTHWSRGQVWPPAPGTCSPLPQGALLAESYWHLSYSRFWHLWLHIHWSYANPECPTERWVNWTMD